MNSKQFPGFFLFLFLIFCIPIQAQEGFVCYFEESEPNPPLGTTICSHNGRSHTPDGTLRVLVVFAGFEGFEGEEANSAQPPLDHWRIHDQISTSFELPDFIDYDPITGITTMDDFMYTDPGLLNSGILDPSTNISNLFFLMSQPNRSFKLVGSVFTNPSGLPQQVVISPQDLSNWGQANRRVAETMMQIWEDEVGAQAARDYFLQFDQRENSPHYAVSNINSNPDDIIDVVAYIWRYSPHWSNQPIPGMDENWVGSKGGYFSPSVTSPSTLINGVDFSDGFLAATGGLRIEKLRELFQHEFGHSIYFAPHNCGSNGVSGSHFPLAYTGTGLASSNIPIFHNMMAAWERWHLGYTDPLGPNNTDGTYVYTIRDFVASGDAIRVPLPFPEGTDRQYLWIENHTKQHSFDIHPNTGTDLNEFGNNDPEHVITDNNAGIYMYVEDMYDDDDLDPCQETGVFGSGGNIYMINPFGNWDMNRNLNEVPSTNMYNAIMYPYEYLEPNPIGGTNPWFQFRTDIDPQTNPGIDYSDNANAPGLVNERNEGDVILREQFGGGTYHHTYRAWGVNGAFPGSSTAFQAGDELSMGANPTVINYPNYNETTQEVAAHILNGLKVRILSTGAQAQVEISYKQTAIDEHVRWTGNILLPDITKDNAYDLVLAPHKQITVDLSKTAHRATNNPLTNDFTNPSVLTIQSGAKVHLLEDSRILVKNHSTLVIEEGAEMLLEDRACIVVEPGGTLWLKGNKIRLNGSDAVIIMKGTLKTDDNVDFTFSGNGFARFFDTHSIDMGVNSNFVLGREAGDKGVRFLTIEDNTTLHLSNRLLSLTDGRVEYKTKAKLSATNADVLFSATTFTPNGSSLNTGFEGTNLISFNAQFNVFNELEKALILTGNTMSPVIADNTVQYCVAGVEIKNMDNVRLEANTFIEQIDYSLRIAQVDVADIYENVILHQFKFGIGCHLQDVNFAYLTHNTLIDQCDIGVEAERSNVFVNYGGTISNNAKGVHFINNPTAEYLLSVGRCGCASIINNDVGVEGDNIVLDIDAIVHQMECNSDVLFPNRFNGNTEVFDICYTDASFPGNTILARGNYWGGLSLGHYSYSIKNNGCITQNNLAVDDTDFITDILTTPSCAVITPGTYPGTPQYPTSIDPQVNCEVIDGGVILQVHQQSKSAYEDLFYEDYPNAKSKYQPIANMDRSNNPNHKCVNLINIAKCIVEGVNNDQFATSYNSWLSSAVRFNPFLAEKQLAVYPNPVSNILTIESKKEEQYMARLYNVYGQQIAAFEFEKKTTYSVDKLNKGVYILEILDSQKRSLQTEKLIVE